MNAADLLFTAAWKGSLLLVLVLLLTRALRTRIPARWAHALLLVALVRLVAPLAPQSPVSIFNLAPNREQRLAEPAQNVVALAGVPRDARPFEAAAPRATRQFGWREGVVALWLAGAVVALARIASRWRAVRRIVQNATPVEPWSRTALLLDECREAMRVKRPVVVCTSSAVDAPALHGFRRPAILVPPGFLESFPVEQLRFVFLHELAHLRRFDLLVNWVVAVVHALHWFNPLVRIAVSRLHEERELACDALALEHLDSREQAAYGGALLRLLDQWRLPPPAPGFVGMASSNHHAMKRRIQMIATFRSESRRAAWMALVVALAVVSLTDARAGEPPRVMVVNLLTPEAQEVIRRLDTNVSLELSSVSIVELANIIANTSGIVIAPAEGAIDEATAAVRIDVKADNVPAHLVLMESLSAVGLAAHFDAAGAQIIRQPEPMPVRMPFRGASPDAVEVDVVVPRGGIAAPPMPPGVQPSLVPAEGNVMFHRTLDVQDETVSDGVTRRKVTFRGSEGGQADGTLELEVRRAGASPSH
ncbi:MAG TPA: M56 family metallopeptidase [Thermoanaerobaculia bacterium]|jgi:beta-lactamase regulating signal transducer with metallopeptidase domain